MTNDKTTALIEAARDVVKWVEPRDFSCNDYIHKLQEALAAFEQPDQYKQQVLGQALITISRQEYESLKREHPAVRKQVACPAECDDGVDWSSGNAEVCDECKGSGTFYTKPAVRELSVDEVAEVIKDNRIRSWPPEDCQNISKALAKLGAIRVVDAYLYETSSITNSQLRLHMGELTADECRIAKAAMELAEYRIKNWLQSPAALDILGNHMRIANGRAHRPWGNLTDTHRSEWRETAKQAITAMMEGL